MAFEEVIFGIRRFIWDEEVLATGFKALNALAADYPTDCGKLGGVEVVLEGMANCDTDYQVQVRGTTALGTLVRVEDNLIKARQHDAVKIINDALAANPEDGQMQWRGIQILELLQPGAGAPVKEKAIKRAQTSAIMRSMSKMSMGASGKEPRPVDKAAHEAALKEVLDDAQEVDDEDDEDETHHESKANEA